MTEECAGSADEGFDDFYADGTALLVYGSSTEDAELAAQVHAWHSPYLASLEMVPASELTEADREENLFIVGGADTNALLAELNGGLPVWFDEGSFEFGGYTYTEPGEGIALIHPSPFAEGAMVLLYVGNTFDGAYSTFTIWTGQHDFATTRGWGVVQQEGALCREGESWGFYAPWAEDYRADWLAWVAEQEQTASAHHVFFYAAGSEAEADMDWLPEWQEERYADILVTLEVEALDHPIRTYLYNSNAEKGEVTGISGNGHANDLNYEVHEVYGGGVYAVGAHEDVHVVASHRIGDTSYALLGEGLAVMVDGEWWGEPLEDWASQFKAKGEIPPLEELIEDFWGYDDTMTYPLAGHFVQWLTDQWGIDAVKAIYVADDLDEAFVSELGMERAEVELEWLEVIP